MNISSYKFIKPIYLILASAMLLRLGWVLFTPALPTSDFATYNKLAHLLASGQSYPNSFRVPGYPFFLASLYTLFGDYLIVPKLGNAILSTLTCLFTYLIAKKSFNDKVALMACGIVALLPSHILYTGLLATEHLFTCLLLASTTLFLFALEHKRAKWLMLAASGFTLGLATLVRPLSLGLPGAWFLYLLWKRYPFKQAILITLLVGITTLAALVPWTIRTSAIAGRFVSLSTEGGITFMMGFNERANGHYIGPVRVDFEHKAREMGLNEFESNDLAFQRAFEFIRENPVRAVALIPLKWFHLFRDDVSGVVWNFDRTSRPLPRALWYILVCICQFYYMTLIALAALGFFSSKNPALITVCMAFFRALSSIGLPFTQFYSVTTGSIFRSCRSWLYSAHLVCLTWFNGGRLGEKHRPVWYPRRMGRVRKCSKF